jgi:hypothetical protein
MFFFGTDKLFAGRLGVNYQLAFFATEETPETQSPSFNSNSVARNAGSTLRLDRECPP